MFKIKGSVSGVFRDVNTGEVTRKLPVLDNHIQDSFLRKFYATSATSLQSLGTELFTATYNPGRQRRDLSSSIAAEVPRIGSDISGVDKTQVTYDYLPGVNLIQMVQRFAPPATDHTINSVGLCTSVSGSTIVGLTNMVWLETPCIQTTTESLDLFYRIQVLFDPSYLSNTQNSRVLTPAEVRIVTDGLADVSAAHLVRASNSSGNKRTVGFLSMSKVNSRKLLAFANYGVLVQSEDTHTFDEEFYKSGVSCVNSLSDNTGKIVTHMGSELGSLYYKSASETDSPIQSVFGHRDTSVTPFYTSTTSQIGLGNVTVNGDNWTDPDHPKYLKVDITDSGVEGVAAYKFRIKSSYSYVGNTFYNDRSPLHWSLSGNQGMHDGFAIQKNLSSAYPIYFDRDVLLFINPNEIIKVDVLTGDSVPTNNTTLVGTDLIPRFLATAICQAEVSPTMDTYVACRDTGVYKFNENFDVLDVINSATTGLENTTGCYGVHVGMGGRIWGFFSHTTQNSLYYSDDAGVSWTKTTLVDAVLDADVTNIAYIHSDTQNHHVAIIYVSGVSGFVNNQPIGIKWWDNDTTTLTDGPANATTVSTVTPYGYGYLADEFHGYQKRITCSPNDSVWASVYAYTSSASPTLFTFGTNAISRADAALELETRSYFTNWALDLSGNDVLHYISDNRNGGSQVETGHYSIYLNLNTLAYEAVQISDASPGLFSNSNATFTVDGEGMWLTNTLSGTELSAVFNLNPGSPQAYTPAVAPIHYDHMYPEYGWDGANWVKGNPNSKLIHSAAELLIDGITIAFDDTAGSSPFFDSDHYTFGVVDGIWADGFTTFEHSWEVYSKATLLNTETESPNLPTTTKTSNTLRKTETDTGAFFQDLASTDVPAMGSLLATGTGLTDDYNAGARSVSPVIDGSLSPFLPFAVTITGTDITNAQGYVEAKFNLVFSSSTARVQYYFGLSTAGKLGTSLDVATIDYAIHIDNQTTAALAENDTRFVSVRVVENGIERAVYPDTVQIDNLSERFRVVMLNNGSMAYLMETSAGEWITLYESPAGSVTIEDLYLDVAYVPTNDYGLIDLAFYSLSGDDTDYYMYLGNGTDQGIYHPEFVSMDPEAVKIEINGVEAIMIGENDSDSVLAANTYSVYPYAGVIRFSASDVGLPVVAEYVTIVNE